MITLNGNQISYGPFTIGEGEDAVNYPANVLDLWSDEQLETIGIVRTPDNTPVPESVPMYKVKKYMLIKKLTTSRDMHAEIIAYMNTLPEPNRSLALIDFGEDEKQIGSPNLIVQSPLALGAKAALGLTDEEYETMVIEANSMA